MKYTLWYARVPLQDISEYRLSGNPGVSATRIGRYAAYTGYPTLKRQAAFYARLKESIAAEGIRNPIVLVSEKGLHTRYGASRMWAARELKLDDVPAIVVDFDGKFQRGIELKTEPQIRAVFSEEPEHIVMEEDDFYYYGLPTRD
jgi:hypothetical protein